MRKVNAVLSILILVFFLIHAILGAFQLIGVGDVQNKLIPRAFETLVMAHAVIGVILTVKTLSALKKAGTGYYKGNELFWAHRISGFAVMVLIFFHFKAFGYYEDGVYRLVQFDTFRLVTQLLLLISVAVHVITNVKPLLISFGIKSLKERVPDILFAVSVLLLFMAVAFIVYFIRWNG